MALEVWAQASAYERYIGRWSREVASHFLRWLGQPPHASWLDVGCGTGALSHAIIHQCQPVHLLGIDRSPGFLRAAAAVDRAAFTVADACHLPIRSGVMDAAVSALALNFMPDVRQAVNELVRVVRSQGVIAAYVWDYAEGMQFVRAFWDEAVALRPEAADLDEARRFPICRPEPLRRLFEAAGLEAVRVAPLESTTVFRDFDDYWSPFLGGQGPAPTYVLSLAEADRIALRDRLQLRLAPETGMPIRLTARAWAVKGTRRAV